jgi:phospholipase C
VDRWKYQHDRFSSRQRSVPRRFERTSTHIFIAGTGGPFIDNTQTPGQCEKVGISDQEWSCYPAMYKTVPEYLEGAGIDWKVFQSADNFDDNPLACKDSPTRLGAPIQCLTPVLVPGFKQFQDAMIYQPTGPLATKGMSRQGVRLGGVEAFKKAANDGTLPPVSYIARPHSSLSRSRASNDGLNDADWPCRGLRVSSVSITGVRSRLTSEHRHPPFAPQAGGDFIKLVIDAFTSSPIYNKSVLLLSYDETGGWGDVS